MNKKQSTYSVKESKARLSDYLDVSAERLRARLKTAWKKQPNRTKVHDKVAN